MASAGQAGEAVRAAAVSVHEPRTDPPPAGPVVGRAARVRRRRSRSPDGRRGPEGAAHAAGTPELMPERVALVTGATRGIARGIALDLARKGWAVAISFKTNERAAETTRAAIEAAGAPALAIQADLGDATEARALVG